MKLDAIKFGLAAAIVSAVIWVICSILVVAMPGSMMSMSGHMLHADFGQMAWTMTWSGFIFGGILWIALSGVIVWALAAVYNRLVG